MSETAVPYRRLAIACRHYHSLFVMADALLGCDVRHKSPCLFGDRVADFPMIDGKMATRLRSNV